MNEQSKFTDILNKNDDARTSLWSSLATRQSGPMPKKFEEYRKQCFERIRAKLIENVIIQFPTQVERFNVEIEGLLETFINQMSYASSTNDAYEIRTITPEKLFREYDLLRIEDGKKSDAWSYGIAGETLEKELKDILDNAVVVAQFKTAEKPYHMEGDF